MPKAEHGNRFVGLLRREWNVHKLASIDTLYDVVKASPTLFFETQIKLNFWKFFGQQNASSSEIFCFDKF